MLNALTEICGILETANFEYCLIGGLAVSVHGIPRFTADLDLLVEPRILEAAVDVLPTDSIVSIKKPELRDPIGGMIQLKLNKVQIDLLVARTDLQLRALERSCKAEILERSINIVSVEDLILLKLSAGGPRDLLDIGGILEVSENKLDWEYLQKKIMAYRLEDEWLTAKSWAEE
jgi:hypothetical protein